MSTLLLNGCSYAHAMQSGANDLGMLLGHNTTVNLGYCGGSNDRTFRTTTDYIINNKVDFVIVMLTFWSRTEGAFTEFSPIEGNWVSYAAPDSLDLVKVADRKFISNKDDIKQYIKHKMVNDCNAAAYKDKLLTNIIQFSGWLDSINLPYLIFGACDMQYDSPGINNEMKKHIINSNPRIINIFNWSSNKFLSECNMIGHAADLHVHPYMKHYQPSEHAPLFSYIAEYIKTL